MLIAMAVYDTVENDRSWMTLETLMSLSKTVNFNRHSLFISDNGSCEATQDIYKQMADVIPFTLIRNGENIGTANAINKAWRSRKPGEPCVKMDNDVVIHQADWADWMEDVFERDPEIGICGLKRKDLAENTWRDEDPSLVYMLHQDIGQRWIVVEQVRHVIGTCQGYSGALLDKIGYLVQPGVYGFDDSLSAVRARAAGFKSVFLHGFEIDHIDPGGDKFCAWKHQEAGRKFPAYNSLVLLYESGMLSVYDDGGFDD